MPWEPFGFCGTQISSPKTVVGFIGFGRIAQATLHRLVAFGIKNVRYHTRNRSAAESTLKTQYSLETLDFVDLDTIARESDLIVVLTPGGADTYHLINDTFLRKCKKTATLVNCARGSVVDSDALALALREERLWSAGLDVIEGEPNVDSKHPLVKEPRLVRSADLGELHFLPLLLIELSSCPI